MEYYLNSEISKNSIRITRTIEEETSSGIWNLINEKTNGIGISPLKIRRLVTDSFANYKKLINGKPLDDDITLFATVATMYQKIWGDKSKDRKKLTWANLKKCNIIQGPPKGKDLIILSTAAKLSENHDVSLLTFDHDFIVFAEEIKKSLNVTIINAGIIPPP